MILFNGQITKNGKYVVYVLDDENFNYKGKLDPCLPVRNHSPDGFCWGYGGSGHAQLALALLYYVTEDDEETTLRLYQEFKCNIISKLDINADWTLTKEEIKSYIEAKK